VQNTAHIKRVCTATAALGPVNFLAAFPYSMLVMAAYASICTNAM
jgi:hypothetical protein